MSAAPFGRESGFTLVEIVVSMTILAVILGLLGGGLRSLSRSADRNADRIQMLDMVSRAFDILKRDTTGLQRVAATDGDNVRYLFSGTATQLSLVTLEPPYPAAEGPYFIEYFIVGKDTGTDLVRARAPYVIGAAEFAPTPANRVVLVQGGVDYRFRYGSKSQQGLVWRDAWTSRTRLPDVVRLDITDARTKLPAAPSFIVQIPANAEIGCVAEEMTLCSANSKGELMANGDGSAVD